MNDKSKANLFFEFLEKIACVIILALAVLTVINVISRRVFELPIFGVTEIVEYGTLTAICLAASNATLNRVHPAVNLVTSKLSPKAAIAVLMLTDIVSLAVMLFVGFGLLPNVINNLNSNRVTDSLGIPYFVVYGLIVLCIYAVACAYILLTIRDIRNIMKPADKMAHAAAKQKGSITPIAKTVRKKPNQSPQTSLEPLPESAEREGEEL